MAQQGQYLYAIVAGAGETAPGLKGIGDNGSHVYTICHRDIGAVVSDSPIVKYPVNRANAMAHQNVMETFMKTHTLLPVRFGTIGEGVDQIRKKVLSDRYDELLSHLRYMSDKIELGLKALWNDRESIFRELLEENRDIRQLRDRILSRKAVSHQGQVRLGEMVKKALDQKREREKKTLLDVLKNHCVEHKCNKIFGDQMVANSAFLVLKEQEKTFDDAVEILVRQEDGRMTFRYVGPIPPANFVEIVVKW